MEIKVHEVPRDAWDKEVIPEIVNVYHKGAIIPCVNCLGFWVPIRKLRTGHIVGTYPCIIPKRRSTQVARPIQTRLKELREMKTYE